MLQALRSKPHPRWPERALSNAFVRNVAKSAATVMDAADGMQTAESKTHTRIVRSALT